MWIWRDLNLVIGEFEKTYSERDIIVETYNLALNYSMNFIISYDNTNIDTYEWIAVDS